MSRCVRVPVLVVGVALAGCAESAAPPVDRSLSLDRAPHHLLQATRGQYAIVGAAGSVGGPGVEDPAGPVVPDLNLSSSTNPDRFVTSFWAVQGKGRGVQIYYRETTGDPWEPYELFYVYAETALRRPDGTPVAPGDSVLITLSIDVTQMETHYAPSGLSFNTKPAYLKKWYAAAGGDFDGDGDTDADDAYIEQNLLDVWTQDDQGRPWSTMAAQQSLSGQWLLVRPEHFSGYAVGW